MKKLKGTAYIELIDEKTGEVESIKEDNMLTNALNYLFNETAFNRAAHKTIYTGSNTYNYDRYSWDIDFFTPLPENTIGGILLFSDNIPEDPEQVYAPGDAHCIGYGSTDSYGGTNTFRGSYNKSESGYLDEGNGYRFVWNFSTSQGNGEIKSLALTTPFGGRFGYGMSLDTEHRENAQSRCYSDVDKTNETSDWYKLGPFFAPSVLSRRNGSVSNSLQAINYNTGWWSNFNSSSDNLNTYGIGKYNASTNEITLVGKIPKEYKQINYTNVNISLFQENLSKICSKITTLLSNQYYYIQEIYDFEDITNENGYLYLLATNGNDSTANRYKIIYCVKINLDDYSIVFEKTINLNDFVVNASQLWGYSVALDIGCVRNNCLYLKQYPKTYQGVNGDGYTILKINLDTDEQTKIILPKYKDNLFNNANNILTYYGHQMFLLEERIIVPQGYIIDLNDEVLYYPIWSQTSSANNDQVSSFARQTVRAGQHDSRLFVISNASAYYNDTSVGITLYTPCLFTINNLQTPITKTQDKAMKITYILREEE